MDHNHNMRCEGEWPKEPGPKGGGRRICIVLGGEIGDVDEMILAVVVGGEEDGIAFIVHRPISSP